MASFHLDKYGILQVSNGQDADWMMCRCSSVVEQRFCKPLARSSNLLIGLKNIVIRK